MPPRLAHQTQPPSRFSFFSLSFLVFTFAPKVPGVPGTVPRNSLLLGDSVTLPAVATQLSIDGPQDERVSFFQVHAGVSLPARDAVAPPLCDHWLQYQTHYSTLTTLQPCSCFILQPDAFLTWILCTYSLFLFI